MFSSETHALMEAAVDAIIVIDHRGRILAANDATSRTFGYRSDEMLGQSVGLLMPEGERAAHDRYVDDHLRTGQARIIGIGRQVTARRKDGSAFPAHLSVGRIASAGPPRFVGLIRDLTQEQAATAALKFQRDRANAFLELHDAILLELGPEGRIREINARGAEYFGGTPTSLANRDWLDFMCTDIERSRARRLLDGALKTSEARSEEIDANGGDFGPRRIHWRCIALRDATDQPAGWLCSGTDVTARAAREAEALAARERMARVARMATVGELASGIAHEINQPLTAITTYARACERYLDMPQPDTTELREALREIGIEGLRAGEIVRRMRSFVGTEHPDRTRLDVNTLIAELEPVLAADARRHGAHIDFKLAPKLPPIEADAAQLQHVVLILVRNALEALDALPEANRAVEVLSRLNDHAEIEIRVTDNGPGVAPSVADRLFEPFATTKRHGTGLGLATCRSLVQAHGGKIGANKNHAPGASFYVTLPAA